jgi:hypothetical protein
MTQDRSIEIDDSDEEEHSQPPLQPITEPIIGQRVWVGTWAGETPSEGVRALGNMVNASFNN